MSQLNRQGFFWGDDGVEKFGNNDDIDNDGQVYDICRVPTATYPFPLASAVTTLVSDDANDSASGTGARRVFVQGLNDGLEIISEEKNTDGLTEVTLDNNYFRINRAFVVTSGDIDGTNIGNIDIKHGATVIGRIGAGIGQTLLGVYTVPVMNRSLYLVRWTADLSGSGSGQISLGFQIRPLGNAWRTTDLGSIARDQNLFSERSVPEKMSAGTDIRIRALSATANNLEVSTRFVLLAR